MRIKVEKTNEEEYGEYFYEYKASQMGWFKPLIWGFGSTPEEAIEHFKSNYKKNFPQQARFKMIVEWNPKEGK